MSESKIDTTDLGTHSQYYANFNTECIRGKIFYASMYYWYSGSECIYSARCVDGKVYNVWDNRDRHVKDNIVTTSSGETKRKLKGDDITEEKTTEFDSDDHDIDSYYEDYKDDFEDIDDAYDDFEDNEEYWDD